MKTLTLLFLCFCINVQGQDLKLEYGNTDVDFHTLWVKSLLKEYSEYEKECYNDSTVITEHIIPEYDRACHMTLMWPPESNYCTNPNHYNKTIYQHKHPEFTDFIKWLKLKYK